MVKSFPKWWTRCSGEVGCGGSEGDELFRDLEKFLLRAFPDWPQSSTPWHAEVMRFILITHPYDRSHDSLKAVHRGAESNLSAENHFHVCFSLYKHGRQIRGNNGDSGMPWAAFISCPLRCKQIDAYRVLLTMRKHSYFQGMRSQWMVWWVYSIRSHQIST